VGFDVLKGVGFRFLVMFRHEPDITPI